MKMDDLKTEPVSDSTLKLVANNDYWPTVRETVSIAQELEKFRAKAKDELTVIDPDQWVSCSPEWLKEHPKGCALAPRVWNEQEGNHYHPKHWPDEVETVMFDLFKSDGHTKCRTDQMTRGEVCDIIRATLIKMRNG